jgi:hypothetical protein
MRWIKNLLNGKSVNVEDELNLQRAQIASMMGHTERQITSSMEMRSRY